MHKVEPDYGGFDYWMQRMNEIGEGSRQRILESFIQHDNFLKTCPKKIIIDNFSKPKVTILSASHTGATTANVSFKLCPGNLETEYSITATSGQQTPVLAAGRSIALTSCVTLDIPLYSLVPGGLTYQLKIVATNSIGSVEALSGFVSGPLVVSCGPGEYLYSCFAPTGIPGIDVIFSEYCGRCIPVEAGYYSPANDNNRYSCTNRPAHADSVRYAISSGLATNNCPIEMVISCQSGYSVEAISQKTCVADSATEVATQMYNFVAGSQADCENSIYQRLGVQLRCTIGGGCGISCGKPGVNNCTSANPQLFGRCVLAHYE